MQIPHSQTSVTPFSRIALPLFLTVLGIYLLLSPAHFLTTPDEELNLRTTLSLIEGYRGAIPPLPGGFASKQGIDGREYAQYGLGLPVLAAPWCMIGRAIDPSEDTSANFLENVTPENQAGTNFLRWWMTVFTMILTALTVLVFTAILQELNFSQSQSVFFSLLYAFTTYTWPHGRTFFTEPLVALCLLSSVAFFLYARHSDERTRWLGYAAIFWAYALFTRLDTIFTLPAAVWLYCTRIENGRYRVHFDPREVLICALPFLIVFITVLLYNQYRFDSFLSTGYEDQAEKVRFITPLLVGLHGFLFTPGRSIFIYSPPLIFMGWGIVRLWKKDPWLCGGIVLLCLLFLCAMSKWQNWAGGYDWGPRHIYQLTPFFMLLAACAFLERPLFNTKLKIAGWAFLFCLGFFVQFLALAADPVLAIKTLLRAWPQVEISPGFTFSAVLMQFTVYLPQFSNPVLHWQWIRGNGVDLLIFQTLKDSPMITFLYLVFTGIPAYGLMRLMSLSREKNQTK